MGPLEIHSDYSPGGSTTVLRLAGPIHLATVAAFQDALRKAGDSDVVLDMKAVDFVDSAGLGAILAHWRESQGRGRRLALASVGKRVATLLSLAQVSGLLHQFGTAEEAEQAFRGR